MKQCESCGMPLHKDPSGKGGGTNKDGSVSDKYCSLCYVNGDFCYPGTDVKEFQDLVEANMKKSGYGRFMRKITRRMIPGYPRRKK